MTPQWLNWALLVEQQAATVQARATKLVNVAVGTVFRAILEANASVALWLQDIANDVLLATRLITSTGTDVDTFVGDFSLTRLPATYATTVETLTRFITNSSTTVLVGATVITGDGTLRFSVVADSTNAWWDPVGANGYIVPVGLASIVVPIQAQTAGTISNVVAGSINLPGSDMSGIDQCTNTAGVTDGADAEGDQALKDRFQLYIAGLSKATLSAVEAAIASVQEGLTYSVEVNQDEQGNWRPGHFVCVVDDGSGAPPAALLSRVYAAVDAVRALCENFSVQPPSVLQISVSLTITVPGGSKAAMLVPLAQQITAYVNSLPVGQMLPISRIAAIAYAYSPSITNVSFVTATRVSGAPTAGQGDVVPGPGQVIKAVAVLVS